MKSCFWGHDWGMWEQYERQFKISPSTWAPKELHGKIFDAVEDWQKRKCKRCGKVEMEKIA